MRLRTGYSFRTAMGLLDEVMAQVETPWAPITDRASTFGWVRWDKLARQENKRPIFGVELAVTPNPHATKITRSYFTFWATSDLEPLNKLLKRATTQFRYEPLLTYQDIKQLPEGLFWAPGRNALLENLNPSQPGLMVLHGPGTPQGQLRWAQEHHLVRVASSDNYYPCPDDRDAYEVMIGRGATSQTWPFHILSQAELQLIAGPDAMSAAEDMAALCTAELRPGKLLSPPKPKSLEEMCRDGAQRLGIDLARQEYSQRLERELEVIQAKQFEDYFFILADLVAAAREMMFVGPARGSSCGSLVCYLMGITQIDPIRHNLIFERFIDITRSDLPDIDIDFSDQRRHLAIAHLEETHGKDRVARLGTVSTFRAKAALNETAAALKIPPWDIARLENSLVERPVGDERMDLRLFDTFKDTEEGRAVLEDHPELALATRLEGHPRHYSQHAAGVIVTDEPVERYVALNARPGEQAASTFCDMKDAEALNLLKIDALGLTQLSILEDCLEMAKQPRDWLEAYPLDDPAAYQVLNSGSFCGIFQMAGAATRNITRQIQVTEFEDLVNLVALSRPGPLSGGGTAEWIARKNGRKQVSYLHPAFEPHLGTTLGILVFQEQVMSIARDIGQMDWPDVIGLRRAIGKKMGAAEFNKYGDKFKKGARKLGLDSYELDKFWNDMLDFGVYAFNRSHSVAYALVAYWCMVLKAKFPLEFGAATLTHERDLDKQKELLRELVAEGYTYAPVDAQLSGEKWTAAQGRLVGPLSMIKGLGPKRQKEILEARREGRSIPKASEKLLASPVTPIDELFPLQKRLAELFPGGLESAGIMSEPKPLGQCQAGDRFSFTIIALLKETTRRDSNDPVAIERRNGKRLGGETRYLNLVLEDDSGKLMARIGRYQFRQFGEPMLEHGEPGNSIYVLRGKMAPDFRVFEVERCKLLGKMKGE